MVTTRANKIRRVLRTIGLAGLALLTSHLAGCNSIDTPRALQVKRWFKHEDPFVTLRDSTDGNRRAEAIGELKEPMQHGGSTQEQEVCIQILTTAAKRDNEPLVRLRAINMLGKYKDPRAVTCLEEVCQQNPGLTPEINSRIRQQALTALAETGNPDARKMLLVVARGTSESPIESSVTDRQQTLDERFAAIRGLRKFTQYDAIETLVHVLETERDAGLRECAHRSLSESTGKDLPADGIAWREMLRNPDAIATREPNFIQRVTGTKLD